MLCVCSVANLIEDNVRGVVIRGPLNNSGVAFPAVEALLHRVHVVFFAATLHTELGCILGLSVLTQATSYADNEVYNNYTQ